MAAEVSVRVRIPKIPMFVTLRVGDERKGVSVPISSLSESDLRAVGAAWTDELVRVALARAEAEEGRPQPPRST